MFYLVDDYYVQTFYPTLLKLLQIPKRSLIHRSKDNMMMAQGSILPRSVCYAHYVGYEGQKLDYAQFACLSLAMLEEFRLVH